VNSSASRQDTRGWRRVASVTTQSPNRGEVNPGLAGKLRAISQNARPAEMAVPASIGEMMKTSTLKWLACFSGLLLLSLLVVAPAVQAAQASRAQGTRTGTRNTSAAVQQPTLSQVQQVLGAPPPRVPAAQRPTLAQVAQVLGHQIGGAPAPGVASAPAPRRGRGGGSFAPATGAAPASSGTSATTVWIVAAAVAGVVLIGGWVFLRRRRQRAAAPACELSAQGC
jgi:hypothetical protein